MIELVVTMAVAAILLMLAAPNLRPFIQNNRMVTQVNELNTALTLGRSEAIKRGASMTVCASSNSASCTGAWHEGWLVFVDEDADGAVDGGTDEVLRTHNSLTAGSTLTFSEDDDWVTYAGSGLATSGASSTFTLCDARGSQSARGIVVGPSGRPRLAIDTDSDGTLNGGDGEELLCGS